MSRYIDLSLGKRLAHDGLATRILAALTETCEMHSPISINNYLKKNHLRVQIILQFVIRRIQKWS